MEMKEFKNHINEIEALTLSKYAKKSCESKGRLKPIDKDDIRGEYQRDRDRIIHSKAFRRLKHKTQVFLSPEGDHYRTRLTHTLEVSQIGRTIARALRLNEDLVEAATLGHDLGHTPFGHAGEAVLNIKLKDEDGFNHAKHSIRVVDFLENNGKGLNLTYEVREAIEVHNTPYTMTPFTLESEIVKYADRFAYINHDIEDAISGNVLTEQDLPQDVCNILGHSKSERINNLIWDMIKESYDKPYVVQSKEFLDATTKLHNFMFKNVYTSKKAKPEEEKAQDILSVLFDYFVAHPEEMPQFYQDILKEYSINRVVADYLASFTDQYCIKTFENIYVPKYWTHA
jgi:dGTPase